MKISARDEYACAAVLELALNYDTEAPVRVQDIAERQSIPMKFLFQIMQILKRLDIVHSRRGTEGGFILTRPPVRSPLETSSVRSAARSSSSLSPGQWQLAFQTHLGRRGPRNRRGAEQHHLRRTCPPRTQRPAPRDVSHLTKTAKKEGQVTFFGQTVTIRNSFWRKK